MTAPRHASGASQHGEAKASTPETERSGGGRRLAAVVSVLVLAIGGGLAGGLAAERPPASAVQPRALASASAPVGSQSSSWYCAGLPGSSEFLGAPRVLLVNTGATDVPAEVEVVGTKGANKSKGVTVPAHGQVTVAPGGIGSAPWLAARVDVEGGGVSASELIDGSAGWTSTPCASETGSEWYFATGTTATGSSLRLSVFNPSANLAVVDLTFLTAAGTTQPQPFQGIVLPPGAFRSLTVGQYVQDQKQVAAVVSARSGAVVATEFQVVHSAGVSGVALRLGVPAPSVAWYMPRAEDISGGTSEVTVFNPTERTETVTVRPRLASGPVAPFTDKLGPDSVWTLDTAEEVRIPDGVTYATTVQASGGPGVVVGRTGAGPSGNAAPQWGDGAPVAAASTHVTRWVVPAVDQPGTAKPASLSLVLQNPGHHPVVAMVSALTASGVHRVGRVTVKAGSFSTLSVGPVPLLVTAAGPLAILGDASRASSPATALAPAIPQG